MTLAILYHAFFKCWINMLRRKGYYSFLGWSGSLFVHKRWHCGFFPLRSLFFDLHFQTDGMVWHLWENWCYMTTSWMYYICIYKLFHTIAHNKKDSRCQIISWIILVERLRNFANICGSRVSGATNDWGMRDHFREEVSFLPFTLSPSIECCLSPPISQF